MRWRHCDLARQRKVGNQAIISSILYQLFQLLHPKLPVLLLCRKKRDADGFQLTIEEIVQKPASIAIGHHELHIVGACIPRSLQLLPEHAQRLASPGSALATQMLYPIEILHLAWLARNRSRKLCVI